MEDDTSKCPQCGETLAVATADNANFYSGGSEVATIDLAMDYCPCCNYQGVVWERE